MIDISLEMPNGIGQSGSRSTGSVKWFSFYRHGRISETRSWELQLDYWGWGKLFGFSLSLDTSGSDHAGPELELVLLGFTINLSAPDNRHWNYDENRFYQYGEPEPGFDYPVEGS